MGAFSEQAATLRQAWETDPRWAGVRRDYPAEDVIRLRGSVVAEHALARRGASRLWDLLHAQDAVHALGAVTGNQAVQMVQAGLQAIYLPGGQGDAGRNLSVPAYPVQSLDRASPAPQTVRRINSALLDAAQVSSPERAASRQWLAPIVADAEPAVEGAPDAFELMKAMIGAGAAGVHFADQLPPGTCGRLGGKVLIPTGQHIKTLTAARLAADVLDVPSLVMARTCAHEASLLTSDADEQDHEFLTGERTAEGFHRVQPGLYARITRGLAFAPYCDLLWLETSTPSLAEARAFADVIYSQYPDQMLAYSCSQAVNWRAHAGSTSIAKFRKELAAMGYRLQCITPAGPRPLNEPVGAVTGGGKASGDQYTPVAVRALSTTASTPTLAENRLTRLSD